MPTRKTRPLAWLKRYLPKPMLLLMECSPDVPLHARTATGRANWCGWPPSQAVVPAPASAFCNSDSVSGVVVVLCSGNRSAGLGLSAPSVQQGLFPEWFGCREILHRRDPYRPEATRQIELVVFGRAPTASAAPLNQHRFAYPVFFVFVFFPIALAPFAVAQFAAFFVGVFLTAISMPLWLPGPQFSNLDKLTFTLFALASYPILLALQLRQPTLIIVSLLAAVYFCVQSRRLITAGMLAALCASKPQLAIAVLLPLSVWCVCAWRARKAFLLSLGATLSVLLIAAEFAVPGWFAEWLATLAAYAHYAGGSPLLADLLQGHCLLPATALLLGAAVWVSFKFQGSDLLFAISFSAAAFALIFPFQLYNAVLLFPGCPMVDRQLQPCNGARPTAHLAVLLHLDCAGRRMGVGNRTLVVQFAGSRLGPDVLAGSLRGRLFVPLHCGGLSGRLCGFQAPSGSAPESKMIDG